MCVFLYVDLQNWLGPLCMAITIGKQNTWWIYRYCILYYIIVSPIGVSNLAIGYPLKLIHSLHWWIQNTLNVPQRRLLTGNWWLLPIYLYVHYSLSLYICLVFHIMIGLPMFSPLCVAIVKRFQNPPWKQPSTPDPGANQGSSSPT